jgi:hypothetical protein
MKQLRYHPFFIRLFNWEYWSFNTVYGPIYLYFIFLGLRVRAFFFFSAANPSIENGGFLMESKWKIHQLIPDALQPRTLFFTAQTNADDVLKALSEAAFSYPLVIKPDIGGRGRGVKKLNGEAALREAVQSFSINFLIQEFVPWENEAGIFYYRYPNESTGHISGIVGKEFLSITGNGHATIDELLRQNPRFILQLDTLRKTFGERIQEVLPEGQTEILVPYGNHARGAKFLDFSDKITPQLTAAIHEACQQVSGFYFGRMDVRYNNWEELEQGKNFSIIELNGAGSEPTHIYDPRHSVFFAWKEIIRHWKILWRISRMNHRNGIPYMTVKEGMEMFRQNRAYEKLLNKHA